ncbi:MAG: 50S ribosomal protein L18 [Sulfurospirillaceae bacterium]|jgi:large subunit ribosomal protein L18|nr:50S ribosomal protein L18 [Sulfurospirillaceae bacterium]MCK9545971.1 50S ribosomal protein L18 [Sulfurospirillaceae bacterium]MDY0237401.1 50S ribosomal protein L18 [Campylobacterales bacterium]NLM98757.1 50S ribosomal protein L18 [Campylobacteraceae bacterium]
MRETTLKRKIALRQKRKLRVRGKISGTPECPRVSIFRSNRRVYAQAIEDVNSTTLAAVDGKKMDLKANKEGAAILGKTMAEALVAKGIQEVKFDRNGYLYHGVVAAFAEAMRENGIKL